MMEVKTQLGSVHKYFGGGLGKMEGGGAKSFRSKGGGQKVWSNWKYNENQNAQFVAKINRIKPQIGSLFQNFPRPFSGPGIAPYT